MFAFRIKGYPTTPIDNQNERVKQKENQKLTARRNVYILLRFAKVILDVFLMVAKEIIIIKDAKGRREF